MTEMTEDDMARPSLKPHPKGDNPARYSGDDTFGPLPKEAQPRGMEESWFYYLGAGKDGTMRTLVYQQDGGTFPDDCTLAGWIADARGGGAKASFSDYDAVAWYKPGYIAFFVDIPGWTLLGESPASAGANNQALYFAKVPAEAAKPNFNPNFSFYNARTQVLDLDGAEAQVLVMENYHFKAPAPGQKPYQPRQPGDPTDYYKFDIYLCAQVESGSGKIYFVIDPGGQSKGP